MSRVSLCAIARSRVGLFAELDIHGISAIMGTMYLHHCTRADRITRIKKHIFIFKYAVFEISAMLICVAIVIMFATFSLQKL